MYGSPFDGLFNGLGRTVTGLLKDVPQAQLGARAFELAKTGLVSFADALAIKNLADRLSKAGQAVMPQGTVMDNLQMGIRAALTGQPAPQPMPPPGMPPLGMAPPGMPPQGAMPPGPPPGPGGAMMSAGLPTLPAPALEGPPPGAPGMAAGGIVAFQEGGQAFDYGNLASGMGLAGPYRDDYVPPESEEEPAVSLADLLGASVGGETEETYAPSPEFINYYKKYRQKLEEDVGKDVGTREQYIADEQARRERSGYGQALKDRATALQGRESKLEELLAKKTKLGKAAAGFKMAQAASQPGATFLGSAAEGLASYVQSKGDLEDRALAAREAMEDRRFDLAQAMEDARARGDERAEARYKEEMAKNEAAQARLSDLMFNTEKMRNEIAQTGIAARTARGKQPNALTELQIRISRLSEMARNATDPRQKRALLNQVNTLQDVASEVLKAHPASVEAERGRIATGERDVKDAIELAVNNALKTESSPLSIAQQNLLLAKAKLEAAAKKGDPTEELQKELEKAERNYNRERKIIKDETLSLFRGVGESGINLNPDDEALYNLYSGSDI